MSSESEMRKETSPNCTPLGVFYRHPQLIQGLSFIGSLGVLGSGLVVAQTDSPIDTVVAPTNNPAPAAVKPAPAPAVSAPAAVPKPPSPSAVSAPAPAPKPVRVRPPRAAFQAPTHKPTHVPAPSSHTSAPAPASVRKPAAPRRATEASAPAPTPVVRKRPRLAAPNLSVPTPTTVAKPPKVILNPSQIQESAQTPVAPNNSYIDRTNYNIGATRRYQAPSAVVLTERSTGCSTVSRNGRLASGICGGVQAPRQRIASSSLPVREPQLNGVTRLPRPPVAPSSVERGTLSTAIFATPSNASGGITTLNPPNVTATANVARSRRDRVFTGHPTVPLNLTRRSNLPIPPGLASGQPAQVGQTAPMGLAYYNLTHRPVGVPKVNQASFIFPLTIPVPITSLFGWRIHPITGERRFHAGTDLGAPQGTPVVAAAAGEVATADFVGGYGLTVILRHEEGTQESYYAHLSEIFVQAGEWVNQGTVIGRVGSTGFSTGPHLHFEWRHLTPDGWVAVDAGNHLEYALGQLIEALKVAQTSQQPGS